MRSPALPDVLKVRGPDMRPRQPWLLSSSRRLRETWSALLARRQYRLLSDDRDGLLDGSLFRWRD